MRRGTLTSSCRLHELRQRSRSAVVLLCAAAVDRMQTEVRTNYNRELFAQGLELGGDAAEVLLLGRRVQLPRLLGPVQALFDQAQPERGLCRVLVGADRGGGQIVFRKCELLVVGVEVPGGGAGQRGDADCHREIWVYRYL